MCFILQLVVIAMLRHPSLIGIASTLNLATIGVATTLSGLLEGPIGLAMRSVTVMSLSRVIPGPTSTCISTFLMLVLFYMGCGAGTTEELLGMYANRPSALRFNSMAILAWSSIWSIVAAIGEDAMTAKLQEESEHKNVFLAKMSHELRFEFARLPELRPNGR
jgi:hypothetical protein